MTRLPPHVPLPEAPWPHLPEHGGPDALGVPRHDFSTNANPISPPEALWHTLRDADRRHYPDPLYHALREHLGQRHQLSALRVLPTAGSSEAIRRLSLTAHLAGLREVWLPEPGYGDYRAAAQALGLTPRPWRTPEELLERLAQATQPALVWLTEPATPDGSSLPRPFWAALLPAAQRCGAWLALDRAYEPLRLEGTDPVPPEVAAQAWQLHSPNKALGLTGVRAGWLQAPASASPQQCEQVRALAPSWVLSAEGVALLLAFEQPEVAEWLAHSRQILVEWRQAQQHELAALGWQMQAAHSVTPFWLTRPAGPLAQLGQRLDALRQAGIKLRDARSLGLPGWVRVSAQPPQARAALVAEAQAHGLFNSAPAPARSSRRQAHLA